MTNIIWVPLNTLNEINIQRNYQPKPFELIVQAFRKSNKHLNLCTIPIQPSQTVRLTELSVIIKFVKASEIAFFSFLICWNTLVNLMCKPQVFYYKNCVVLFYRKPRYTHYCSVWNILLGRVNQTWKIWREWERQRVKWHKQIEGNKKHPSHTAHLFITIVGGLSLSQARALNSHA